jgi:hypothetical protein
MFHFVSRLAAPLIAVAASACAAPPADAPTGQGQGGSAQRLLIGTTADWPPQRLAEEAARRAGVPVLGVIALAPRSYAVTVECDDGSCRRVIERLAADPAFATSVHLDPRRMLPRRPSAPSAQ